MTFIHYNGQIAAIVGASGLHLAPHLEDRPVGDPECCFVAFMAAYALDVLIGASAGPYTDEKAALFARFALIDEGDLRSMADLADADVAKQLNVPIGEVATSREDLDVQGPCCAPPPCRTLGSPAAMTGSMPTSWPRPPAIRRSPP